MAGPHSDPSLQKPLHDMHFDINPSSNHYHHHQAKTQKYQLLGSVGERSRYLCVCFEAGAKANYRGAGAEAIDGKEVFIVLYYFTITTSQNDTPVTIKV